MEHHKQYDSLGRLYWEYLRRDIPLYDELFRENVLTNCTDYSHKLTGPKENAGYHKSHISKGELGELSKIDEELHEAYDASSQGVKLMVLIELSDLYGAIESYLEKHHPDTTMNDLKRMSDATKRAFKSGERK